MNISNPHLYLIERSASLFFIYDCKQERFTYMNSSCTDFFDLESAEIEPSVLRHLVHPEDQQYVLSRLDACLDGQIVPDFECRIQRGTHLRWLRITLNLTHVNNEKLLIGQAEDITSAKENVEALLKHNTKKNAILNILAHDLAGPIGTISNLASILGKDTRKFQDPAVNRYIDLISKISKSGIKLIRDFLDQEFLESANVNLMKTRVELVEKISVTMEDYFNTQNDLQIEFSCKSTHDRIYADIDENKFIQVIHNLISNALKFTPDGGTIDVYIQENEEDIVISVADNGIGIPVKYHPTLFDKFSNARRNGLKEQPSTGLGMSIIKTLVEWHNGVIWFKSEEHKGTTFFIQLPKM
jgi:two-component system sensor histidine kinase VicK